MNALLSPVLERPTTARTLTERPATGRPTAVRPPLRLVPPPRLAQPSGTATAPGSAAAGFEPRTIDADLDAGLDAELDAGDAGLRADSGIGEDARLLCATLALCVIEILAGARPLDQLGRWVNDAVFIQLLRRTVIAARSREATGDDARRALDEGCAGVIVSNHGGRQLDTCYASLRALPEVVCAMNGQGTILVDGGIRRGSDILKALCMGASAVLVGRAYAYGLMAEGREGVAKAISILKADLERTMILLGCASLKDLDASFVDVPKHWSPPA